jgi:VanZ family protein
VSSSTTEDPKPALSRIDAILWVAAAASLAWLLIASLGPAPRIMNTFHFADKVFHALHYALTTLLFLLAAVWRPGRGPGPAPRAATAIVVTAVALGAAIEVIQGFIGRQVDALDLGADAVGVALGLGVWFALRPRSRRGIRRPALPFRSTRP